MLGMLFLKTGYYWFDKFRNEDEGRYAGSVQNIDWERGTGRGNIFYKAKRSDRHSMKLYKESCKKDVLKFSFCNRVVNSWNKLPEQVVNCGSINSFKSNIDKFLRKNGWTL